MTQSELYSIKIFKLNPDSEEFDEIDIRGKQLFETFDTKSVLLFVDPILSTIWLWHGKESNVRMKFIAAQKASSVRDKYIFDAKINAIEEGNEPDSFKKFLGLYNRENE
ncbi:MAG: hypothetical protein GF317_16450 [Candidatus Lokiarchaeota archaeon]|nr:hypothetical protein [Candidatus Lokiarchaeota archaeon]MBD3201126.1 hypothetical protein [Candidatus Lokiarchaeota archaeon]